MRPLLLGGAEEGVNFLPAWVDFSWELVPDERDIAKQISVIVTLF